jgi:hypothetical protein
VESLLLGRTRSASGSIFYYFESFLAAICVLQRTGGEETAMCRNFSCSAPPEHLKEQHGRLNERGRRMARRKKRREISREGAAPACMQIRRRAPAINFICHKTATEVELEASPARVDVCCVFELGRRRKTFEPTRDASSGFTSAVTGPPPSLPALLCLRKSLISIRKRRRRLLSLLNHLARGRARMRAQFMD